MKAVINQDKILYFSEKAGTIEVGSAPRGAGLERIRWTGEKLVDLAGLSQIWVSPLGGKSFDLHAHQMPGSQLVDMEYVDRKRLTIDNGLIRLKTEDELISEKKASKILIEKNKVRRRLALKNGDTSDQLADAYKLIFMLIEYIREPTPAIEKLLDIIIPEIKDIYSDEQKQGVSRNLKNLKEEMQGYYKNKEKIQDMSTDQILIKKKETKKNKAVMEETLISPK